MIKFILILLALTFLQAYINCGDDYLCQDYQTCCPMDGGWGCCQYQNANCCDLKFCCQKGHICKDGSCSITTNFLEQFENFSLIQPTRISL